MKKKFWVRHFPVTKFLFGVPSVLGNDSIVISSGISLVLTQILSLLDGTAHIHIMASLPNS